MCEFNTKITITQLLRLTIVSAKSKIYSPRRGYLSPGNSIVLEIAATLLFISVTIFCWFWGSFCWNSSTLPTDQGPVSRNSRNFTGHFRQTPQLFCFSLPWKRVKKSAFQNKWLVVSQITFRAQKFFGTCEKQAPVYFRDLRTRCLQRTTTEILPYHTSTHVCKFVKLHNMLNSQRLEISQKPFPAKNLLKQTTYLLLEAKNPSYFNCVRANKTQSVSQSICN